MEDEWVQNLPPKHRAKAVAVDDWLMGMIGRSYDIPVSPDEKVITTIPKTEKVIYFQSICTSIGMRKDNLIKYLEILENARVINFEVNTKKRDRFYVLHIEMYSRLSETTKTYLRRHGFKADMIKTYKLNLINGTKSEVNKIPIADDYPREEESQQINSPRKITPHLEEVNRKREEIKNRRK